MTDTPTEHGRNVRATGFFGSETERTTAVTVALTAGDTSKLKSLVAGLEARDLADLIVMLPADERVQLIQSLGADFDYDALSELDETVRDELSEALPNELIAGPRPSSTPTTPPTSSRASRTPTSTTCSRRCRAPSAPPLERNLDYPEETAGRLMQADFVAVPPYWSVGPGDRPHARGGRPARHVLRHLRRRPDAPRARLARPVAAAAHQAARDRRQIMDRGRQIVLATADQEEVARQFERYDLRSAPVVDANQRLVGVVTVDDVVEVIEQEADEDVKRLAGVGDESHQRHRARRGADALRLAVRQSADGDPRLGRDQAVRRHDRADGVARRADADRRLDGRQCRHADHDRLRARARDAGTAAGQGAARRACAKSRSACSTASRSR